ncbi:MAG: hypothetical protein R3E79_48580 [Caldilineaceae bacterium]
MSTKKNERQFACRPITTESPAMAWKVQPNDVGDSVKRLDWNEYAPISPDRVRRRYYEL